MKTNHPTDPAELPGATTGPQSMAAIYMRGEPAEATDFAGPNGKEAVFDICLNGELCGSQTASTGIEAVNMFARAQKRFWKQREKLTACRR